MKGLAFLLLLLPFAASAATMHVNTTADNTTAGNSQCTLREAIANVNAAADSTGGDCVAGTGAGDTIKFAFAMPATIRLALGQLLIQRDVNITNAASGSLHIDGAGKSRLFDVAAGTTSISGLTIERGAADHGGGILVEHGARVALIKSTLVGNTVSGGNLGYAGSETQGGGIFNAGTLDLTDCALTRNTVAGDDGDGYGGGIYNAGGTLSVTNCVLTRNSVTGFGFTGGGAIYNAGGTMTLTACRLVANKVVSEYPSYGGGIYNDPDGTASLTGCTLTRNRTFTGGDSYTLGGGILNGGTMTLAGCTLDRNVTLVKDLGESSGGGIDNEGVLTMADCTLTGNIALAPGRDSNLAAGGGISNGYGIDFSGPNLVTMKNCTLSRNATLVRRMGESDGGGIANDGSMMLTNSTLTGNRSSTCSIPYNCFSSGGGIYSEGDMTLTNCTLSGNRAQRPILESDDYSYGGAINGYESLVLRNTIIANSGAARNCSGDPVTSGGHNLSSDNSCFSSGGSDLLNTNPQLAVLGNYGGPTQTMALCTDAGRPASCRGASPAIDAGDDAVTGPPDNLSTDQRGLPRRSGAHVDIGAYEVQ